MAILARTITTRGRELLSVIEKSNLKVILNGDPTYWPADPSKRPDVINFFVAKRIHRPQCSLTTLADLSSDHVPVLRNLSLLVSLRPSLYSLTDRHMDWNLYRQQIEANSQHHIPIRIAADLDMAVKNFTFVLQEAAHLSIPTPTIPTSQLLNADCVALLRQRRRARKHWQRIRTGSALRDYQ